MMNLSKLFDIQAKLDERIVHEHNLQGQDLLDKKILALKVELGECANEWRGFKFWSKDQEPRTQGLNPLRNFNPLLEEYVDCLHFILSIGNEMGGLPERNMKFIHFKKMPTTLDQFMWTNYKVLELYKTYRDKGKEYMAYDFVHAFNAILGLGEKLGFTWEQIEQAYLDKNKVNHERQESGY